MARLFRWVWGMGGRGAVLAGIVVWVGVLLGAFLGVPLALAALACALLFAFVAWDAKKISPGPLSASHAQSGALELNRPLLEQLTRTARVSESTAALTPSSRAVNASSV